MRILICCEEVFWSNQEKHEKSGHYLLITGYDDIDNVMYCGYRETYLLCVF